MKAWKITQPGQNLDKELIGTIRITILCNSTRKNSTEIGNGKHLLWKFFVTGSNYEKCWYLKEGFASVWHEI